MAMRIRWYGAERIAQYSRSRAALDATGRRHRAIIRPVSWRKQSSCGVVKSLFAASVKKARNGPSTQLIKAKSCVVRSSARLKPKSSGNFLALKR